MLLSIDAYLHANLRYQSISPWDIVDERILESDWLRSDISEEPNFSQTCDFRRIIKDIFALWFLENFIFLGQFLLIGMAHTHSLTHKEHYHTPF